MIIRSQLVDELMAIGKMALRSNEVESIYYYSSIQN